MVRTRARPARSAARIHVPDGRFMQIELFCGESQVMIAEEFPEFGAVSPLTPYCLATLP